jgi:hypothetical protein
MSWFKMAPPSVIFKGFYYRNHYLFMAPHIQIGVRLSPIFSLILLDSDVGGRENINNSGVTSEFKGA